ncbi:HAD hydrolase family IIB [Acetobacterium woodii DSM 1030]|uniref:HAD hydrolase family IIB n=2 Tax=Acetobacterium woodii TaxID=33952 RepID=H6LFY4_ACEWD|nr:HAD hydrolase family IIB [Acetobacterium woodii DSM 1030]
MGQGVRMIKIIVSDLDGTLLNSKKELPERFPKLIKALNREGIRFVPASGRAVHTLKVQFFEYFHEIGLICENGNVVLDCGEMIYHVSIEKKDLVELLGLIEKIDELRPALCGIHATYIMDRLPAFEAQVRRFFYNTVIVENFEEVINQEEICKISNVDGINPLTNAWPKLFSITDHYDLIPSGENWIDIVKKGENKGKALQMLMANIGAKPEETMVFGDFLNDLSLMEVCEHTFAMKNAHPDLKAVAKNITHKTNEEEGVIDTIIEVLNLKL